MAGLERAVVAAPVCPLMAAPRWAGPRTDEALHGMELELLERAGEGWWRARTPYRYEGYVPRRCLAEGAARWSALPKRVVRRRTAADVLAGADVRAPRLTTLPLGAVVAVAGTAEDWTEVELADGRRGYVRAGVLAPWPPEDPAALPQEVLRDRLAEAGLAYRDSQYRWGGKTPWGIDCSGLVSMAYWLNGLTVYRDARLEPGFDLGEVPREAMARGDVLYFPGHAALYLGAGRYLHATGRAGSDGVTVNALDPEDPRFRPDLARALTQVGSYQGFHP